MKKYILATALLASTTFAFADGYTGNTAQRTTGYTGPANTAVRLVTVKQAQSMADDTYVTMRGKVVQHIKSDKYMFQDSTGQIVVEIDDDLWYGLTLGPNDTVEIIGEIDRDGPWGKVDVDVKNIKKI